MRIVFMSLATLALIGVGSLGFSQSLKHIEAGDSIVRVKTGLNYVTVLEVSEPIVNVVKSGQSFYIERKDNKVFVKPLTKSARGNLFIWTANQRFTYSLEVVDYVEQVDFVVEQPRAMGQNGGTLQPPALAPVDEKKLVIKTLLALMRSTPVRQSQNLAELNDGVNILLTSFLQVEGKLYLSYFVKNNSPAVYSVRRPTVVSMDFLQTPEPLANLRQTQLGSREALEIDRSGAVQLEVFHSEHSLTEIPPGEAGLGVLGVTPPIGTDAETSVIQLRFDEHLEQIPVATVVL